LAEVFSEIKRWCCHFKR